jgi:hypothetical protein
MTSKQTHTPRDCDEFQQQLPELFDSEQDLGAHDHIQTCHNCSALVRDLEYIAAQAKLLLPIHDPSPAVWDNIQNTLSREAKGGNKNS